MTLPFPPVIDSTMLVKFRACPRKFLYEHIHMLDPGESVHLRFGGALARGLEVARKAFFLQGIPAPEAENMALNAASDYWGDFPAPEKGAKNWGSLLLAIAGYFRQWPLATDPIKPLGGNSGIEFTFAIPLPISNPETGEPILYAGRFDLLGEWDGMTVIVDEKTTGHGFGESWSKEWTLRNQFMMYQWACEQYGIRVSQVFIRGISILKTKIDYAPAIASYPPHLIARAHKQTLYDIQRMVDCWTSDYWPFNFGDTCTAYGGCFARDLCSAIEPEEWFSQFPRRTWSPLRQDPEETT